MRHPPGEAHSLPAPAPLVKTFAAGPLPANRASEVASRRLATHTIGTRRPLSSPLSLSALLSQAAMPQLQPAQPLWTRVAQNASGDTTRHATGFNLPLTASVVSTKPTAPKSANKIDVAVLAALAALATSPKPVVFFIRRNHAPPPMCRRHRKLSPGASLRTSNPQTTCDLCRLERISRQQSCPSSQ